ncbi:MAG: SDR family NAD(P)-dependent oxidoreductase, partial [candidate division NC10 bacterium]|nr:SDR family NAD(P)-dependent oxidoreductase [candidate division NC10 bacterium]
MDLGLKGKGAIVAAASKGIGKAAALRLAQEGAKVAICSRNEDALKKAADEIRMSSGGVVLPIRADVTQDEDIKNLVGQTAAAFGRIDILVNNAGGPPTGIFEELTDEHWQGAFRLTLLSVIRLIREVLPH